MLCLFDLDGTLIDSEEGIVACVRHALIQMGVPVPDHAQLRGWIGPPLRHNFAPLLGHDQARVEAAVEHYHDRFQSHGHREYAIYPGIEALIRQLHAEGHTLAIVTSKVASNAEPVVAALPFGDLFTRMYTPDARSALSEKAAMIAAALHDFGIEPSQAVMIGDRKFDIEGAVANNVRGIGVLWGFGDRAELEHAGATDIVADTRQLVELLTQDQTA
ncbi:MAG TPA: HAD hydrolase-like protein [Dyella sp.]|uniref:HAD hydrolase-like protein n=1 Tax=Dyella sp. TaxID=1869338 RepID=UPI002F949349